MTWTLDSNLFNQIGLDSGALTMLGTVVHSFGETGEYRGTIQRGNGPEATFYVSVDGSSPIAQANIDLARADADADATDHPASCDCGCRESRRFVVHPRGYVVFHVSGGGGGYWVNVRKADENPDLPAYDSRRLHQGDIFAGVLMRPGRYSLRNELGDASAEITVPYPTVGKTAYRPPAPLEVECGKEIKPGKIHLHPLQGLNVHILEPARIRIELVEPDDGPADRARQGRPGWRKQALPRE